MKPLRPILAFAALALLGVAPRASAEELSPQDLYDKVVKSCVYIITPLKGSYAEASGSLIDAERKLVVTNYHVVEEQPWVYVQFPFFSKGELVNDKGKYKDRVPAGLATKGTVLFRDKSRDLALVRVDSVPVGTHAIPLARSSPKQGTPVWQIGNAGAVAQVFRVSKGEVSTVAPEKFVVGGGGEPFEIRAIMITATNPINPGDSGGPLFDKRGYQVGVTESHRRGASLVSRFVDVMEVRSFLNEKKITIKELSDEPDPSSALKKNPKLTTPGSKGTKVAPPDGDERAAAELQRAKLFANGEDLRRVH